MEATYNFAACSAQSLFGTIFDHGSWQLSPSCNSCAATVGVKIWPQMGQIITSPARKTIRASCFYNFSRTPVSKTTMVAPRTSKTITAWWLPSNLKQVPLVMKCQINERSQIFPNTNLDPLGKTGGYLRLCSFFCALHNLHLGAF